MGVVFDIPASADETTISRIKHLQTLGFPDSGKVGTGHRRAYGFSEAFKICLAFQLADVGMSSALAAQLLTSEWSVIVTALAAAAAGDKSAPLIGITPYALGTDAARDRAAIPASGLMPRGKAGPSKISAPHRPRVHLDPLALVVELKRALRTLDGLATDEIESAAQFFSTCA